MADSDKQPADSANVENSNMVSGTRRQFLGGTGAGITGALFGMPGDDGNGGQSSRFAVKEHDHSGEYDESSHLGAEAPVDSIRAKDIINTEQPVFDIRAYGAVGDGETDNTWAIHEAIDDAAEVNGTVLFPRGDWVSDWIILRHEHNGVTLTGVGYGSRIIPLQAIDEKAAFTWTAYGGDDPLIDLGAVNFARGIQLNDNFSPPAGTHPASLGEFDFNYREPTPFENITIKNLRLDGRKDDLFDIPVTDVGAPETPLGKPTGHGIDFSGQSGADRNLAVKNIWSHDWTYQGIDIKTGSVNASNLMVWDNGFHGVGHGDSDAGTSAPGEMSNFTNVIAFRNGQYGIDHSSGAAQWTNFSCFNNGWGLKTSEGGVIAKFVNGQLINNLHLGFQMTGAADRIWMDNIESRDNGLAGFGFRRGGDIHVGSITSINDNSIEKETQFSDPDPAGSSIRINHEDTKVIADTVRVEGSPTAGLDILGGEFRVNDLQSRNNGEDGVKHRSGEFVCKGGVIEGNGAVGLELAPGFTDPDPSDRAVVSNLRIADDTAVVVGPDREGPVTLRDMDLRAATDPLVVQQGSVTPTVENVDGYQTASGGQATFSGDGETTAFLIEHGLAGAPTRINVTPDFSSDAASGVGVSGVSEEEFDVRFQDPPAAGTDNVTVYWSAELR